MTDELMDPPEPGDEEPRLKAKNLKNRPLLIRPTDHRTETGQDGKPWEYVECDVWVLDRSGVEEEATGVRFSWWRARNQIKNAMGRFIACRPVEQDDNSVILVPLKDEARKVAGQVMADLQTAPAPSPTKADEEGTEPF